MTAIKDIERTIIEVLCSQALADNLGDIRDAEVDLWGLLGIEFEGIGDWDYDRSVFQNTKERLEAHGYEIPKYLQDSTEGRQ